MLTVCAFACGAERGGSRNRNLNGTFGKGMSQMSHPPGGRGGGSLEIDIEMGPSRKAVKSTLLGSDIFVEGEGSESLKSKKRKCPRNINFERSLSRIPC